MPLTIVVNKGTSPRPRIVTPAVVVQQARSVGHPNASQALAVTIPIITIDQRGLNYDTRRRSGQTEFRFRTGQIRLTLRQEIYIANDLSSCAQGVWAQHEQDHVKDNQSLMSRMDRAIRAHRNLQTIFFSPRWRPRGSFNAIQSRVETTIGDIFRKLTGDMARSRDTTAEYARTQRTILQRCPGPFYHTVVRGDWLSKLARFYYGNSRFWPSIYKANKRVVGADPDLIYPGQKLVIPNKP